MSQVFVVEPTRTDFLDGLKDFGEVTYIFDGHRPSIFSEAYRDAIRDGLQRCNYNPHEDFIAVVGKQVPLFILAAEITAAYGSFTALLFSSSERRYIPRTIGGVFDETRND